jgi:V/A-type H+-transporting ATPase subunit D
MTQVAGLRRVPPGRAGRLWLRHRLTVAHRGAELLDQKLRILNAERQRLALRLERTDRAWKAASREAETWHRRAALVGGERSLRLAQDGGSAQVEVVWAQSMGVRYPSEATCVVPERPPSATGMGSAALVRAADAYREAMAAAVQHAVAEAAVRVMETEEAATRRRLRAIRNRWLPRLEEALARTEQAMEEGEHAEGVRLRWATGWSPLRPGISTEERFR